MVPQLEPLKAANPIYSSAYSLRRATRDNPPPLGTLLRRAHLDRSHHRWRLLDLVLEFAVAFAEGVEAVGLAPACAGGAVAVKDLPHVHMSVTSKHPRHQARRWRQGLGP